MAPHIIRPALDVIAEYNSHDAANRPDVCLVAVTSSLYDFWCNVVGRSADRPRHIVNMSHTVSSSRVYRLQLLSSGYCNGCIKVTPKQVIIIIIIIISSSSSSSSIVQLTFTAVPVSYLYYL